MRVHRASRALLVSVAAAGILGTTGMAATGAVAADHGPAVTKKTCKVSAYTDRVDRKTDKFGNGAIKCNFTPAYTKLTVTLYKGKKKMATAHCSSHGRSCFKATREVKDDARIQTWRTKVTGSWGHGKSKTVWSTPMYG
ncbi:MULTISPECIES: hypothetical protein [Streptomyces]|uniref:hypothetical protein n=1 Tax=Streptomyces TaxID=1883 RepID=UPI0011E4CBEB|nr:hypothetical protein [Streptomyces sp. MOE7]